MSKAGITSILREYFEEKGKFMTYEEYLQSTDKPVRPHLIKRYVGNWNKLQNLIGPIEPKVVAPIKVATKAENANATTKK